MRRFFVLLASSAAVFILGILLFPMEQAHAAATVVHTQNIFAVSYNNLSGDTGLVGQEFQAALSGPVTQIKMPMQRYQNVSGVGALCQVQINTVGVNDTIGSTPVQLPTSAPTTYADWVTFTLNTPFNIIEGQWYWVVWSCGNSTQYANTRVFGNAVDDHPGDWGRSTDRGTTISARTSTINDIAMSVIIDATVESAITLYPEPYGEQCDFDYWSVNVTIEEDHIAQLEDVQWNSVYPNRENGVVISVFYGPHGNVGTWNYFDMGTVRVPSEGNLFNYTALIPKNRDLDDWIDYYVIACICSKYEFAGTQCDQNSSNFIACSPVYGPMDIQDDATCPADTKPYTHGTDFSFATGDTPFNLDICEDVEGTLTSGFCSLFAFLFMPSQKALSRYTELSTMIERKPPFGYFTVYKNALETLEESTTATSTTDGVSLAANLSTIKTISFVDTIYDIVEWILWIMFALFVFHRIRHFSPSE